MVDFLNYVFRVFFPTFFDRFFELLYAPFQYPKMICILFPLLTTVLLLELYFGRYPREEKGYHYALENTVYLLFVAVDLVRYLIVEQTVITSVKAFTIIAIIIYAVILSIFDFFHKIPRKIAYKTSSKSMIGFTAYIGIIVVYSDILLDLSSLSLIVTGLSIVTLFLMYRFVIGFIHFMEPPAHDDVEELLQNVEEELREAAKEAKKKS